MQQLSAQDASFVYLETPHTPMHIGSVGIYDPSTALIGSRIRRSTSISFTSDRAIMSDPEVYAAALRATFAAMKAAVMKPTSIKPVEANDDTPVRKPPARPRAARSKGAK